ncbi:hypothetical protein CEXT_213301 [Caerostris extrusa]|uniref:Uncharacterized protein n=1 Tax=Caerostris extrusa TaxID=172846 RepID=A0AAV4Q552_CAEEX|nr:hypothetical protein CEXT_213301 [Caerostris extrusa]
MISVTSKVTRTTYKNYFCAVCNEDIYMDQLTPWDLSLEGQSNASEVYLMSALSVRGAVLPERHRAKCATDCTEEKVQKEKGGSYMAVVALLQGEKEVLYRNSHCAICNHMEASSLRCGRCSWEDNIGVKEGLFRIVLRGRIMSRYR